MIRVLIVDDERYARRDLRQLLERRSGFEVVAEAASGSEALATIVDVEPDVVFVDIQMPGMTGLDLLERLPLDPGPVFVFVTAYDQYAVRAFELAALDYLLKPIREDRLAACLDRVEARLKEKEAGSVRLDVQDLLEGYRASRSLRRKDRHVAVRTREGDQVISAASILWIGAEDYYVRLALGDTSYLARSSMNRMEDVLDPDRFVRVHRSTIVNLDAVQRLETTSDGAAFVHLSDGSKRRVSRSGRLRLEKAIAFLG